MNNILDIKCFIASPGDTAEERDACEKVFEDINNGLGKISGFRLSSLRWEKDIYSSVGEYGQQVINEQVDGNYDLFIGIMKTRFGTPTPQAGSGTEEEFNNAYEKHKNGEIDNIFFYFGNPSVSPYEIDYDQFQKVKDFRNRIGDQGVLHVEYVNTEDFKEKLKQDLTNYFNANRPASRRQKKKKSEEPEIIKSKITHYEYRKLWEEIRRSKDFTKKTIGQIQKKSLFCRFSKVIFPQEYLINQLMTKEPLTEEKAFLFALAVKDIGQVPSYYINYHKDDEELHKQPLWHRLIERENTLRGVTGTLSGAEDDWAFYEQIQRSLFHLDFSTSKALIRQWNAKGYWVQNKAMRMAVYEDQLKDAQQLLDEAIKKEKNPTEKLFEIILANFISRKWPQPYSTDEFWKYGMDAQGDMLSFMMSNLCKKIEKPKRHSWIGSTWELGDGHEDYVKSLRILQFIIDSGIYVSMPGIYMFDIASWYIVFSNLYKHFPYPCFFYSIQYNDKDVQRRIGEDFAYSEELQRFNEDIIIKSLDAVGNEETPISFKKGILNVTATMYIAVDESIWFEKFKETVFKQFLQELPNAKDSAELVFNVKFALGSIKNPDNISWAFQQLISRYAVNESIVSDIIVNNLMINRIQDKQPIDSILIFPNVLSIDSLDLLDTLNSEGFLSKSCLQSNCDRICNANIEDIPHNRVALFQVFNLVRNCKEAIDRVKQCFLSMDIWHCGVLHNSEFGWTEPQYIRLNLLNDKIAWTNDEFAIIKNNLVKNVSLYSRASQAIHKESFMKNIQVRYLSDMMQFIDGLKGERYQMLLDTQKEIEALLLERTQYADNIDLMMSDQSADVDNALRNIYEGIVNNGIEQYRDDVDFLISRAIMKTPVALTRNLRYIRFIIEKHCEEMMVLGYTQKLNKLLSVYKDSDSWTLLDLRYAFNYLYYIAQALKQNGESNDAIDFWIEDAFVRKFVVE